MLGGIRRLDRKERAGAHMQGHLVERDPALREAGDEGVGEMQSRRRRGDRAFRLCEQGLIVDAVALIRRAARGDIGRQRHVATLLDRLVEHRTMEGESERHLAALALVLDRGVKLAEEADLAFLPEAHHVARRQPFRGPHEGAPARAVEAPVQRRLDRRLGSAPDAPAAQARRDHLGIVDHERIAGAQQLRKIAHPAVVEFRHQAGPHHQKPRRVAGRSRTQRDPFGRQLEVEEVGAHALSYKGARLRSWPPRHQPPKIRNATQWNRNAPYRRGG